ncbi:FAD-dependent monooxygenase [Pseudonocardia sp. Cha107L01]|uniref:FAD-dependent monooxygenase n=1 Tax=Pseudonocardia sp. Cha107L01 TaxID=3457576 RepID=UPI00403ECB9F
MLVPQFLTEAVLRERLAELGRTPRYGHELTGFDQDEGGVTARLSGTDGTSYRTRSGFVPWPGPTCSRSRRRFRWTVRSTSPLSGSRHCWPRGPAAGTSWSDRCRGPRPTA